MDVESHASMKRPLNKYIRRSYKSVPCPQALGYTTGKTLGSGKYAKVKAAWSPFEREMIAIKIVNKAKVNKEELAKFLPREIAILQKVSHPHIIKMFQIVETERQCFFMTEIAENGNVLDYLNFRCVLTEGEAHHIFSQMCDAVSYCHSLGIAHRDIKLENVFFDKNMDVKVGDFGFALECKNKLCCTPVGSFTYKAPEIMLSLVDEFDPFKADSWSMGVCLYALVNEWYPFGGDYECYNNSLADYQNLQLEYHLTEEFHSLVSSLLTINATTRPLISEIRFHSWMTDCPSIRPSWYDTSDKYTIQTCLPSYLHNIKPRHLCTSQSSSCNNAVVPYAQSSMEDIKDSDLSCGADAEICTVLDDIAEPGEFTRDQVKEATCVAAHMKAEAAGIIQVVSFAVERATDVSNFKYVGNAIFEGTSNNDTPSDSIPPKVDTSVAIKCATNCDEYGKVFHMETASIEIDNSTNRAPHPGDTVESMFLPKEPSTIADITSTSGVETVAEVTSQPETVAEVTSQPDSVDSHHHATSSQGPHKTRHFKARIRSAGRRLLSFIRRIKRQHAHQ